MREGRSVHEIGRFRGLETILEVTGHKNSLFYGREGVFKVGGQDKWRFSGRKVADKKETPSKGYAHNIYTIIRRISAASSASARLSKKVEAAGTPGPTEGSDRHAPDRGCQRQLTGVKIVAKKKPGGEPGVFFACYKRNKFIC